MSVVLAGRRRIYLLVLFRERVDPPRALPTVADPVGAPATTPASDRVRRDARLMVSARMQRRWGRSVFGFSFFVLAVGTGAGRADGDAGVRAGVPS